MGETHLINDLLNLETCNSMSSFLNCIHEYSKTIISSQVLTSDLLNNNLIDEIKNLPDYVLVSFGKTLSEIKCNIMDEEGKRDHDIYLRHTSSRKLIVTDVKLPYSPHQDREFTSIKEVTMVFRDYIKRLDAYFQELEAIDQQCKVVEPLNPTFKDDYRRILIEDRTWLHIEVTHEGSARNVHLIRQSEQLYDKLHAGLLAWDHDKNIAENICCIFDLTNVLTSHIKYIEPLNKQSETPSCGICFCISLEDCPGLPQPLCQNPKCNVYFHNNCLFQWLVVCAGGTLPTFGVANGICPTCFQPITCSGRDHL